MRYLVTGGSGYIGSRLIERAGELGDVERIVIADVRPPRVFRPGVDYRPLDVSDRAAVEALFAAERPDVVIHLAFIVNPIHDERRMYEIDVGGTQNVLDSASAAGVSHLLVTSSATAYGAFPDNPVPLTEEHPVRGVPDYEYARDKAECDRLCQLWALHHPERTMTIVRPCIVFGPNVDNYLVRLWTKQPFFADFGRPLPELQFVHEDDLIEALLRLLAGRHSGAYNIAGDGALSGPDSAALIGLPTRRVPLPLYRALAAGLWRAHLSETPPGEIRFVLYPWLVATEKIKRDAGWQPRYTSREAFEETMRSHGKLAAAG